MNIKKEVKALVEKVSGVLIFKFCVVPM